MSRGKRNKHNTRRRRMNQKKGQSPHPPKEGQWDVLQGAFVALADYAMLPTTVAQMVRSTEAVALVENKPLLIERTKSLCNDCTLLTKTLVGIHEEHIGRVGEPKNSDDAIHAVDVYQRYLEWAEQYEALVYPTYMAINEQIGHAVGVDVMALKPTDLPQFKEKEPEHVERAESGNDGAEATAAVADAGDASHSGDGASPAGV